MSDSGTATQDNSLLTNLKNKIAFNLHKATYDPEANKFVTEQQAKTQEEKSEKQAQTTEEKKEQSGDPNTFSAKRLASKVKNQTVTILKSIFYPFLALMLAMIVTNEMIIYSVPVRIIFFIFTFFICFFLHYVGILLGIYYLFKGGYSYWLNNMTDMPKKDIMPTIFALLPITTYKPLSKLGRIFMYPFTYPKTENGAEKLSEIMKNYWQDLQVSFPGIDKVKNMPIFVEGIKKAQDELMHLHDIKQNNVQQVSELNQTKPV